MDPSSGALGVYFVLEYLQVRVFGSSSLVDRPPSRLSIRNIPLYGCMDRGSCYTPRKKLITDRHDGWFWSYQHH